MGCEGCNRQTLSKLLRIKMIRIYPTLIPCGKGLMPFKEHNLLIICWCIIHFNCCSEEFVINCWCWSDDDIWWGFDNWWLQFADDFERFNGSEYGSHDCVSLKTWLSWVSNSSISVIVFFSLLQDLKIESVDYTAIVGIYI